jgi:peptide/nickel transport system permease protein
MVALLQIFGFSMLLVRPVQDPAADAKLASERRQVLKNARHGILPAAGLPQPGEWAFDLQYMTPYTRLNTVLRYRQRMKQHQHLMMYKDDYTSTMQERRSDSGIQDLDQLSSITLPTLWQMERNNEDLLLERYHQQMATAQPDSAIYRHASAAAQWLKDRKQWLEQQSLLVRAEVMPLLRPYHWEDDAGGEQTLNRYIGWLDLTRVNRKDLMAALLFGTRISLVVGVIAVSLALIIGIPIGAIAGYYGGSTDILISRLLEIWETMPAFLMLLMIVAMAQSKSIFLVITVIGIFGWTTFSRYIRGEFLKQRNLTYVEACRCLGFGDARIVFNHILPNAIPPILTLLPFAIMGAIASEAGLSFLGLGEEGSCSWGVLMDEGRTAFPGESYLLWPPAILLTILLVATALVGDAMRDALDPKLRR